MSAILTGDAVAEDSSKTIQDYIVKPGLVAGVGTLAAKMWFLPEQNMSVPMLGRDLPVSLVLAGTLYGATMLGKVAADYVLPAISTSKEFSTISSLVQPTLAGAGAVGIFDLVNADAIAVKGVGHVFLLGALSEIVGSWLYDNVWVSWFMTPQ